MLYNRSAVPSKRENRAAFGKRSYNQWNFERALRPPKSRRVSGTKPKGGDPGSPVEPYPLPTVEL